MKIRDSSNQSSSKSKQGTSLKRGSGSKKSHNQKSDNTSKSSNLKLGTQQRAQAYGINLQHQRVNSMIDKKTASKNNRVLIKSNNEITLENVNLSNQLRGKSQGGNRIQTSKPSFTDNLIQTQDPSNLKSYR